MKGRVLCSPFTILAEIAGGEADSLMFQTEFYLLAKINQHLYWKKLWPTLIYSNGVQAYRQQELTPLSNV